MKVLFSPAARVLAVAAIGLVAAACTCPGAGRHHGMAAHGESGAMGCAACAKGRAGESVWCDHCGVGFVGGEKVACKGCFAAKTGGPACPMCAKKAM